MTIIDNARAIEAALQRLQGPAAAGKLVVKTEVVDGVPGPATLLHPGTCALPLDGGMIDPGASVYVRPNPATASAAENPGAWLVTAGGVLVDVEAVQGGDRANKDGGTTYHWDPPELGIEAASVADAAGITGGSYSGAFAGLRQVSHFKPTVTSTEPNQALFMAGTFDFPAVVLGWAGMGPLDGAQAAAPGPRTARTGRGMLYKNTWTIWVATSRLDSQAARSEEGTILLQDIIEILQDARRVRDRSFFVSAEPGAKAVSARPAYLAPTAYVDVITLETIFVLVRNPEPRVYNDWLRTRMKLYTAPNAGSPPAPPLELPNVVVPMPPGGPGAPPFPDEPPPTT